MQTLMLLYRAAMDFWNLHHDTVNKVLIDVSTLFVILCVWHISRAGEEGRKFVCSLIPLFGGWILTASVIAHYGSAPLGLLVLGTGIALTALLDDGGETADATAGD